MFLEKRQSPPPVVGPLCCSPEFVFVLPGGFLLRVVVGFSDPAEASSLPRVLGLSGQVNFLDLWVHPVIPFVPIVGWGVVLGFLPAQKVLTRGLGLLEITLLPRPWPRKVHLAGLGESLRQSSVQGSVRGFVQPRRSLREALSY